MRVCILGDSHVGCLKEAWVKHHISYENTDVKFFAAPQSGLAALELTNGCLRTTDSRVADSLRLTSGGQDTIRLSDYDVFLIMGLRLLVPGIHTDISRAVLSQCCDDIISSSLSRQIALQIKDHSGQPVYAGHKPLHAMTRPPKNFRDYGEVFQVLRTKLQVQDIQLLRQPKETLVTPWGTRMEFAQGSRRLHADTLPDENREHPAGEVRHMNAAFGELLLGNFFSQLHEDEPGLRTK